MLRTVTIHRVGNRDSLFMGCDRELIMMAAVICAALVFTAQDIRATVVGVSFWFGSLIILRIMAKSDPKLRHVYLRHRRYQRYYPARSTPFRKNSTQQGNQYKKC